MINASRETMNIVRALLNRPSSQQGRSVPMRGRECQQARLLRLDATSTRP